MKSSEIGGLVASSDVLIEMLSRKNVRLDLVIRLDIVGGRTPPLETRMILRDCFHHPFQSIVERYGVKRGRRYLEVLLLRLRPMVGGSRG